MASCRICLELLKMPVCLPCGHVFCSQCIIATVQTMKPSNSMHRCPTCRAWYNVAPMDLKTVPPNLRPFITPSVRRLFIDTVPSDGTTEIEASTALDGLLPRTCPSWPAHDSGPLSSQGLLDSSSASPSSNKVSEIARLRAENLALRNHCEMWRKRAEMHGEGNLQLLKFARGLRDQASQIARERNDLEKRCFLLKKTLDGDASYSGEMMKCQHPNYLPSTGSPSLRCDKNLTAMDNSYSPLSPSFPTPQSAPLHLRHRSSQSAEFGQPSSSTPVEIFERPHKRQRTAD